MLHVPAVSHRGFIGISQYQAEILTVDLCFRLRDRIVRKPRLIFCLCNSLSIIRGIAIRMVLRSSFRNSKKAAVVTVGTSAKR